MALAIGKPLTGEHVVQRCRVLLVSLEDDRDELRRRVEAARIHHGIAREELKGWLFLSAPGRKAGKLAVTENGAHEVSVLAPELSEQIVLLSIDVVCIDPLVKSHSLVENDNNAIDFS
jgi:RecA-family ATPase